MPVTEEKRKWCSFSASVCELLLFLIAFGDNNDGMWTWYVRLIFMLLIEAQICNPWTKCFCINLFFCHLLLEHFPICFLFQLLLVSLTCLTISYIMIPIHTPMCSAQSLLSHLLIKEEKLQLLLLHYANLDTIYESTALNCCK